MTARTSDAASSEAIVRLVDGDPVLSGSVALLRGSGFRVHRYDTVSAFLARRGDDAPGCAVIDLDMPDGCGLQVQQAIAAAENPLPVIFLTGHGDVQTSVLAMKNGAIDFLTKPAPSDGLLDAIRRALVFDSEARAERWEHNRLRTQYESLTPREREVFRRVAHGLLNKQIAFELGTSERTVKAHRANVMRKMSLHSVADLARVATRLLNLDRARSGSG
jgi:FixJ family two-component response regulator